MGATGAAALWGIGWRPGGRPAAALVDPHYAGDPVAVGNGLAVSHRTPGRSPIAVENSRPGAAGFRLSGHRFATDRSGEVAGYASATSVAPGEELIFRVSVAPAQRYRATIYRIGHYGGAGARTVTRGPWLDGTTQPAPTVSPDTGAVSCAWSPGWRLRIGADWVSGQYLALLSTASGHHHWVPFVVRDPARTAAGLVVIPTSAYQAYNWWPVDGRTGASLYFGFDDAGKSSAAHRSRAVSHDRPYVENGLPHLAADDIGFWGEADQWMSETGGPQAVEEVQLAESPFTHKGTTHRQHTRLYRAPSGAWVFAAGSLGWTRALHDPAIADPRVDRATRNLLHRVLDEGPVEAV